MVLLYGGNIEWLKFCPKLGHLPLSQYDRWDSR